MPTSLHTSDLSQIPFLVTFLPFNLFDTRNVTGHRHDHRLPDGVQVCGLHGAAQVHSRDLPRRLQRHGVSPLSRRHTHHSNNPCNSTSLNFTHTLRYETHAIVELVTNFKIESQKVITISGLSGFKAKGQGSAIEVLTFCFCFSLSLSLSLSQHLQPLSLSVSLSLSHHLQPLSLSPTPKTLTQPVVVDLLSFTADGAHAVDIGEEGSWDGTSVLTFTTGSDADRVAPKEATVISSYGGKP